MKGVEQNRERKPVIGINVDIEGDKPKEMKVQELYIKAIESAGGIPVLLPPVPSGDLSTLLKRLDGVMLIGGRDYDPALYGQQPEPTVTLLDCQRNQFDFSLTHAIINDTTLPFLGVCAGSQILNIALGGDLIQDIPSHKPESRVMHSSPNGWTKGFNKHVVTLVANSKLQRIYGKSQLNVPTSHHQSVNKLGTGLTVTAHAEDGITEAIELPGERFVIGVQWHPERDFETNSLLFREFVRQASAHQETDVTTNASHREALTPSVR